ncbi:MAG: hypothetical protein AAFN30_09880, partial [Actinomycetota bacterium]
MWNEGDLIVRRELLGYSPIGPPPSPGPWHGQVWLEVPSSSRRTIRSPSFHMDAHPRIRPGPIVGA